VDQTRGWFYSLLAISTLLGRGPAYRNVIVNDLVLDAEGQKMSKSRGNVVDPWEAIGEFGADAIRWYLLASSHPWLPKRFDPAGVREVQRKVFDTLRSTYHFFSLYANLEGWRRNAEAPRRRRAPLMDRWLLSRLATVTRAGDVAAGGYNLTHAVRELGDFIVDDLSNWYVRRSRDRFWGSADRDDTRAAFATLHQALVDVTRLMAPVAPFLADWLHRALTGGERAPGRFPSRRARSRTNAGAGDGGGAPLATLGRAARERGGIRVRQPLGTLYAVVPPDVEMDDELLEILRDELNVRTVEFMDRRGGAGDVQRAAQLPGARRALRQAHAAVAEASAQLDSAALAAFRAASRSPSRSTANALALIGPTTWRSCSRARRLRWWRRRGVHRGARPHDDPGAAGEGLARELVNRVQRLRKESGLEVADRIRLGVGGATRCGRAAGAHRDFVMGETLDPVELETSLAADRWRRTTYSAAARVRGSRRVWRSPLPYDRASPGSPSAPGASDRERRSRGSVHGRSPRARWPPGSSSAVRRRPRQGALPGPGRRGIVVVDQVTKVIAQQTLPPYEPVPVLGDFFRLTYIYNPGAAFGCTWGSWSRYVFLVLTVVAWSCSSLFRATPATDRLRLIAIALVTGGAIGNFIDRVRSPRGRDRLLRLRDRRPALAGVQHRRHRRHHRGASSSRSRSGGRSRSGRRRMIDPGEARVELVVDEAGDAAGQLPRRAAGPLPLAHRAADRGGDASR
jgi:hypothetical protein